MHRHKATKPNKKHILSVTLEKNGLKGDMGINILHSFAFNSLCPRSYPQHETIAGFLKRKPKRRSSVYKSTILQCCISIQKNEHKKDLQ